MIRLITHSDLDGAGCVIVAKHFFNPDRVYATHCDYNTITDVTKEVIERADEYEMIYFTDICPEEAEVIHLSKLSNVLILDHHKSRQELAGRFDILALDLNQCGTKLFYSHLIHKFGEEKRNSKLEEFVGLVDCYDRWTTDDAAKKKEADNLNTIFSFYGTNYFENQRGYDPGQDVIEKERFILKVLQHKEEIYIKQQMKKIEPLKIGGKLFALVFATKLTSKVAETINNIGLYDGVVIPRPTDDSVTLYSHKMDMSKIAKNLGGGGHPGASGFSVDFKTKIKYIIQELLKKGIK